MKIVVREDLAWAGGLFEGEGCFLVGKGNGVYPHVRNVRAILASSDEDVLCRFANILGFGSVTLRRQELNRKRVFVWSAASFEDFQATVAFLWPWLGLRRRAKAIECLREMRAYYAQGGRQRGINRRRQ